MILITHEREFFFISDFAPVLEPLTMVLPIDDIDTVSNVSLEQICLLFPKQDKVTLLDTMDAIQGLFPETPLTIFTPKSNLRVIDKNVKAVPLSNWDGLAVSQLLHSWLLWKAECNDQQFGRLLGFSEAMRVVFNEIKIIGPMQDPVLIQGPPGTGKELVALEMHEHGRKGKTFLAVNCAGLSKELAASELFGHERGAFSGALVEKQGFFKDAGNGTLFLDEIGELNLEVQAQLLRAIQENTVRKVGSSHQKPFSARVILGTNRDLIEGVKEGRFRQDLFDRITFATYLPPLVERRADILPLAQYFLDQYNHKHSKKLWIPNDMVETLLDYAWPGNVRELKQVITKAASFTRLSDGPPNADRLNAHMERRRISGAGEGNQLNVNWSLPWKKFHDAVLRQYMQVVMKRAGGDKKKAMDMSGMSRATFYEKLKLLE